MDPVSSPGRDYPWAAFLVAAAAILLAAATARPYVGGWNDGSRLATVEALVDHHTLAIEDSTFAAGTRDKLFINGHYYSDKSPTPALLLAGVYGAWRAAGGPAARARPDLFCLLMTLASSGLAYVVAVCCIDQLGGAAGLGGAARLALTATFGLATVALPYAAHVNNHALLLGVTAALMLGFVRLAEARASGRLPWGRLAVLGALTGLGYGIDLGVGPVLVVCAGALVVYRCRRPAAVALFAAAALPWLLLHHTVNYAVGGTLGPANAVAAYFDWPGCPFNAANMTGGWAHESAGHFLLYAASLLVGKQGFLGHNPTLFLLVPALGYLLRRGRELPEVLFALALCGGAWLAYAAGSNNSSGRCLSIRWFVPLLAPAYYLLAVGLKRCPRALPDLLVLGAAGAAIAGLGWWQGPWMQHMVPGLWPIETAALLALVEYRLRRRLMAPRPAIPIPAARPVARAA